MLCDFPMEAKLKIPTAPILFIRMIKTPKFYFPVLYQTDIAVFENVGWIFKKCHKKFF